MRGDGREAPDSSAARRPVPPSAAMPPSSARERWLPLVSRIFWRGTRAVTTGGAGSVSYGPHRDTYGPAVAISGDTVALGEPSDHVGRLVILVSDIDRDGLRDGIDACPRDPLNNVEGGCTRTSAAYLVLDDLITLGDVATETRGDEFHITATFTNTSETSDRQPVLRGHRPDR